MRRIQVPLSDVLVGSRFAKGAEADVNLEAPPMDDLDFETTLPRESLAGAARDALRSIYDGLDGEVISLEDI